MDMAIDFWNKQNRLVHIFVSLESDSTIFLLFTKQRNSQMYSTFSILLHELVLWKMLNLMDFQIFK